MAHERLNKWTEETFKLIENNYLDRLLEIYPAELSPERPLPDAIRKKIVELYRDGRYKDLVILLIKLKDESYPFPVEHPYAALLRHLREDERSRVINQNPQIIKKLAEIIASLGLDNIIRGVERPKDINRMLGATFKGWVNNRFREQPFRIVDTPNQFETCPNDRICIYVGSDVEIANFLRIRLGLREPRNGFFARDIIVKVRNLYIIGEARFLSTPGGSQTRDLKNTLEFVETMERIMETERRFNVKGIALLDGIVWFHRPYVELIKRCAKGERVVMSALLLKDFLLDTFKHLR